MNNNADSDALTDVLRTLLYGAWQDGITSEEDTDSLAEWLAPRLASYVTTPGCRVCGCEDTGTSTDCYRVELDLCSRCVTPPVEGTQKTPAQPEG